MFEVLSDDNVILYAIKAYDRPNCIKAEFKEDFSRLRYVRRYIHSYRKTGELKERNILNHIIILYNVFGDAATRLLFYKIDPKEYSTLKTFLLFLNRMPDKVIGIQGKDILSSDIPVDLYVSAVLRKI